MKCLNLMRTSLIWPLFALSAACASSTKPSSSLSLPINPKEAEYRICKDDKGFCFQWRDCPIIRVWRECTKMSYRVEFSDTEKIKELRLMGFRLIRGESEL